MAAAETIPDSTPSGSRTPGPSSAIHEGALRNERIPESGRPFAYSDKADFDAGALNQPGIARHAVATLVRMSPQVSGGDSKAPEAAPRIRTSRRKIGPKKCRAAANDSKNAHQTGDAAVSKGRRPNWND